MSPSRNHVVRIDLVQSTVYAVRGERTVLIDAGPAGHVERLLKKLAHNGVHPADLSAVVLTHCHPDHAGGAAELQRRLRVPIAVRADEIGWATAGRSVFFDALRPFGHLLRRVMAPTFPSFTPDMSLDDDTSLTQFGAELTVMHTPGHTPGSISLLHPPTGDAFVGDLLAGGMTRENRPSWPFFAEDTTQIRHSVRRLLDRRPHRLLSGHGRPASAASVARRFC